MSGPSHYQSYLLRLWRDSARPDWQASLQSTATEQIYYFADTEHLWAFLQAQLGAGEDGPKIGYAPPGRSELGALD